MLRSMMQDTRYAIRQWRNAPAFALTVIAVLALGLDANIAVFRLLSGIVLRPGGRYIYGVRAHDAVTFGAVTLVLAASSFLAAWLPARRAAAVDPILALRSE
jgi:ABC-type lipoprotein release transport system permease subunit